MRVKKRCVPPESRHCKLHYDFTAVAARDVDFCFAERTPREGLTALADGFAATGEIVVVGVRGNGQCIRLE